MRLWHIDLIKFLPDSQLIAQWRELNLIYAKEPRHILINYVYDRDRIYLLNYSNTVIKELANRGIKVRSYDKYRAYFKDVPIDESVKTKRYPQHDLVYLDICYYNLKEKFLRGQKDFDKFAFKRLADFVIYEKYKGEDE